MAQFLDLTGLTRFKGKNDELYAKKDGYYQNLGAGVADQLSSAVGIEDKVPYNFRTSGGSVDIGDRERVDAIVGVSVPWNQLVDETESKTDHGITTTFSNGVFSFSGTATSTYAIVANAGSEGNLIQKDHVCLSLADTSNIPEGVTLYRRVAYGSTTSGNGSPNGIFKSTVEGTKYYQYRIAGTVAGTAYSGSFTIQCFDLTKMLGSTIADCIYTLEQGTAGAGVAYFRKLFPKPYYAYNSGELLSVKTSAHKMVGFNQWDEQWEVGALNGIGQPTTESTAIRSKNFCRCVPNTSYYVRSSKTDGGSQNRYYLKILWYDADENFISGSWENNRTITSPDNAAYFKICTNTSTAVYGNTYNHDICINFHWDGERDGEYEPYEAHEYALDDITLRGILKLDASNNLYTDGDRYLPDGTVERWYGQVTLTGSENWSIDSGASDRGGNPTSRFYIAKNDLVKPSGSANTRDYTNHMTSTTHTLKGAYVNQFDMTGIEMGVTGYQASGDSNYLYIIVNNTINTTITTVDALKSWLSSHYLEVVYELATPTTETASPYQQTQIVDDFGTEEFVDAAVEANERDVAIPVGHETFYQNNLKAKLEMAPNSPDGDGVYVVQQSNGENEYIPLVIPTELPTAPTDDGTYVLKITVSGGTVAKAWVEEV